MKSLSYKNGNVTQSPGSDLSYLGFRRQKTPIPNTVKYRGEVRKGTGIKEGKGEETQKNGIKYKGSWKNNLYHGKGKLRDKNGDTYIGIFKNGEKKAISEIIFSDGKIIKGSYKDEFFEMEMLQSLTQTETSTKVSLCLISLSYYSEL